MWYRSHCYRVQTPASVTGIFICIFLTDTPQSFIKVGLFCSGSVDVTALSLENDSVWQQQANRCRRSAQSAKSLVTTWCGGWKLQVCVDICVCVCLARPFIHQKSRTKHKAYRDEMFPTSRGWGMWFYKTRYNTYSFCSLTLCVFVWGFFYSLFFFWETDLTCLFGCVFMLLWLWLSFGNTSESVTLHIKYVFLL